MSWRQGVGEQGSWSLRKKTVDSLKGLAGCGTVQSHRGNRFTKGHMLKAWSWLGLGGGKCHGTANFGEDWHSSFKDDSVAPRVRGHNAGSLPVPGVPWLHTCYFRPCFCHMVPCAVLWHGGNPHRLWAPGLESHISTNRLTPGSLLTLHHKWVLFIILWFTEIDIENGRNSF